MSIASPLLYLSLINSSTTGKTSLSDLQVQNDLSEDNLFCRRYYIYECERIAPDGDRSAVISDSGRNGCTVHGTSTASWQSMPLWPHPTHRAKDCHPQEPEGRRSLSGYATEYKAAIWHLTNTTHLLAFALACGKQLKLNRSSFVSTPQVRKK